MDSPFVLGLKGAHYRVSPNPLQAPDLLDPALSPMLGCRRGPILQAFSTPRGALCRWSRLPLRDKIRAICARPQHPPISGFKPGSTVLLKLFPPTPIRHPTSASRCSLILFFLLLGPALPSCSSRTSPAWDGYSLNFGNRASGCFLNFGEHSYKIKTFGSAPGVVLPDPAGVSVCLPCFGVGGRTRDFHFSFPELC